MHGIGGLLSKWLDQRFTLPSYIGSMIVAVIVRNVCDFTKVLRISARVVDDLGMIALALFLTMALMSLKLWELAGLAGPMVGAFFIDFSNALIITTYINFVQP